MGDVERLLGELRQDVVEAVVGDVELKRDGLIAEAERLVDQLQQIGHTDQTVGQRELGIEQVDVAVAYVEVVIEDAVIEQHLHVVLLHHAGAVAVVFVAFDEDVAARLLLDEQLEVGRHQVDAALQSEFLADERRFEDSLAHVVVAPQFGHDALDVGGLCGGVGFELLRIEVGAGHVFECLFAEVAYQRLSR